MKHIFSVHSPVTFLVAYTTIKHLNLNREDVLILSSKYNVPLDDYKVIPSFYEAKNKTLWQRLITFNVPRAFDAYINQYIKEEGFIAYVDLMSYYQKILVTHKNCKGFHFIEEGNSTYQTTDDIDDITWIERQDDFRTKRIDYKSLLRVLRGYNLRLLSLPYLYTAYSNMKETKFYSFSENAYYCVPKSKKVIVRPSRKDPNINKLAGNHSVSDACIWLDGSNARYTGLEESYYYKAIEKAIHILKKRGVIKNKVYAKLRPDIKDTSNNALVKILKKNEIEVEIMQNDMIIEAFLMQSKHCSVIGVMTSVVQYAHAFGHKAYSIYGLFEKQPPTFFDRMTGFWENIENLKLET